MAVHYVKRARTAHLRPYDVRRANTRLIRSCGEYLFIPPLCVLRIYADALCRRFRNDAMSSAGVHAHAIRALRYGDARLVAVSCQRFLLFVHDDVHNGVSHAERLDIASHGDGCIVRLCYNLLSARMFLFVRCRVVRLGRADDIVLYCYKNS